MKLISWNVNGIRACKNKGFLHFLEEHQPDILGIQEIKAKVDQIDDELQNPPGYHTYFYPADRPGYSGTGLYTKKEPEKVEYGLEDDYFNGEGRVITAHYPDLIFITTYIPNGKNDLSRVSYKIEFSEGIMQHANKLREEFPEKAVIICGDVNTAHKEIDLARPKQNRKNTGFLPEECEWVDRLVEHGWIDTFRHCHPEQTDVYSWWSYMGNARAKNVGWRIDYHYINQEHEQKIDDSYYLPSVHGSDHCPVVVELKN